MKFISWNVNGLRAVCGKGFADIFADLDADFVCLQETKLQQGQIDLAFPGYESYWNYAERKGYSGTVIFTRHKPLSVNLGIGIDCHDTEGRVVTLEMDDFYLVNVYTPNSGTELARLPYRAEWDKAFADYVCALDKKKPVIICGDLNVAHNDIDLCRPEANHNSAGFTDTEREASAPCSTEASPTRSAACIPTPKRPIHGGATASAPATTTAAGASTTSLCRSGLCRAYPRPKSSQR